MKVRFTVVVFDGPDTRIGVVGSLPSLGSWSPVNCIALQPVLDPPRTELRPTTFTTVADIPEIALPIHFLHQAVAIQGGAGTISIGRGGTTSGSTSTAGKSKSDESMPATTAVSPPSSPSKFGGTTATSTITNDTNLLLLPQGAPSAAAAAGATLPATTNGSSGSSTGSTNTSTTTGGGSVSSIVSNSGGSSVGNVNGNLQSSNSSTAKLVTSFEYKFIVWKDEIHSSSLPAPRDECATMQQEVSSHLSPHGYLYTVADFHIPTTLKHLPPLVQARYKSPPLPHQHVIWEGNGSDHNRRVVVPDGTSEKELYANSETDMANVFTSMKHVMKVDFLMRGDDDQSIIYALPPTHFLVPQLWDMGIGRCEQIHTGRYYSALQRNHEMHFNKLAPRIFVGSCPRKLQHLQLLKSDYKVATIFNFQTVEDIRVNWVDDEHYPDPNDHTPERLKLIYSSLSLQHIWMPVTDMSTPARASMMAQAAWLVAGVLVANPDKNIYVHCNAGVGRAIACVSAFLHFCIGLTEMETALLVTMRRPVAFFDWVALRAGKVDFDLKYARALACLPVIENDTATSTVKRGIQNDKICVDE